jgi:uncharacterized DUF497 family protein
LSIQIYIQPMADGFDWDDGNREKCRKHGVTIAEIEQLFGGGADVTTDAGHSLTEARNRAVGRISSGRYVFVVFTMRMRDGRELIRPISARYMHRKEISRYEKGRSAAQAIPRLQDRRRR